MNPRKYYITLLSLIFIISLTASAELQVNKGDSITVNDANSTITWGKDYTFNTTSFNLYQDTLEINRTGELTDWNISITSNTTPQINSTLYRYNLSEPPKTGETVLHVETSTVSPATVDYRFTGIPKIENEHYVLERDNEQISTFDSGNTASWTHSQWNADHNFTLTYREKPEQEDEQDNQDDSGSSGGGGIDVGGGYSNDDSQSDSHSWSFTDKNRFTFDTINEETGLQEVTVNTGENRSSFRIDTEKLDDTPSRLQRENQYSLYSINTSAPGNEITSTRIRFEVNQSFANKYDQVVLSRFEDGDWNELPTRPVEQTGDTWLYEADSTGFSYYTVTGENTQQPETNTGTEDNQTGSEQEENQTQPSEPGDDQQERETRREAQNLIQQAQKQVEPGEPGYQILQQATQNLENSNYQQAESLAQQAIQENQQQQQENDLPLRILVPAVILLTILVTAGGYLLYRKRKIQEIQREIARIQTQLQKQPDARREDLYQEIEKAEKHLKNNNYQKAKKKLKKIDNQISQ
jgi:PGF-pre-PGF domain-containing protein